MSFHCPVSLQVAQGHLLSGVYRTQHSWSQGFCGCLCCWWLCWAGAGEAPSPAGTVTGAVTGKVGARALLSPWSMWAPHALWWEPIPPGNASPPCPSPGLL